MKNLRKIKIVSRASILAKVQAQEVGKAITLRHPSVSIQYATIKASADRDLAIKITEYIKKMYDPIWNPIQTHLAQYKKLYNKERRKIDKINV